ncbi:signal transduction histidine kinase [Eoetvoesiella caeni]|uniref:histidine kinase n=2 Tax=Eoetvoesiella caeni TaxID=645616 RepID=A0A366H7F2_9BURK|nr:signal transduction histidine kinase [Eoetvoesiella caeni]
MAMRKTGMSLTSRVAWALTALVAVFVVVFCLMAYFIFDRMEDDLVDAVLTTQAEQIQDQIAKGEAIPKQMNRAELGASIQGWVVADADDAAKLPSLLQPLGPGMHLLTPQARTWHVLVAPTAQGLLYLRYDATAHEGRVRDFGMIIASLGLLCVLGALLLARWFGRLVVGPMVDLTNRLSAWAPGEPGLTVARDDEMGQLIETFNRVQNRVEESIAFEREFASNLSHEIRTPLTAIRSDSEMALFDPQLSPDAALRFKRIIASADAVSSGLASARVLARPELSQPVNLSLWQSLDEAWLGFQHEAEKEGLTLQNEIPMAMRLEVDRYAVLIVMRNLIRNAIEHAAPATLTVRAVSDVCLQFSDDGPGIPPEVLPLVFERYYSYRRVDTAEDGPTANNRAETRRGLGLAIAKRVCDVYQWSLRVQSSGAADASGTVFTLCFAHGVAAPANKPQ